jgi:hypothetical protein
MQLPALSQVGALMQLLCAQERRTPSMTQLIRLMLGQTWSLLV